MWSTEILLARSEGSQIQKTDGTERNSTTIILFRTFSQTSVLRLPRFSATYKKNAAGWPDLLHLFENDCEKILMNDELVGMGLSGVTVSSGPDFGRGGAFEVGRILTEVGILCSTSWL